MRRLEILKGLAAASLLPTLPQSARVTRARARNLLRRVRPSDPGWPKPAEWARLREAAGGSLIRPHALYDSTGLFFVHNGVGSEDRSADGFIQLR